MRYIIFVLILITVGKSQILQPAQPEKSVQPEQSEQLQQQERTEQQEPPKQPEQLVQVGQQDYTSLWVLFRCLSYVCQSKLKQCGKSEGCFQKLLQCQPQTREKVNWNNWFNCTADHPVAHETVKCNMMYTCVLNYHPVLGTNITNYLGNKNIYPRYLSMHHFPSSQNEIIYPKLDEICIINSCQKQTLYCIISEICNAFHTMCVATSFGNFNQFNICILRMSMVNYYLMELSQCWTKCMFY